MSIETKHYVVTNTGDIEKLAELILSGQQTADNGRGTYLKALIGTTQHELGIKPRLRAVSGHKLTEEQSAEQLRTFNAVAKRFHEAVLQVVYHEGPKAAKADVRRRTGFARSSASTVRRWMLAGNDITGIVPARATKASLQLPSNGNSRRRASIEALSKRAARLTAQMHDVARKLVAANKDTARTVLEPMLATVTAYLRDAGAEMTATKTGVVVPVDFTALRAAKKAA